MKMTGLAAGTLRAVVADLGYRNLDDDDRFVGRNTTTEVLAQFVVDTTGRADMSQFKVLKSTHDLFTNAVRSSLPQMKFYPAEVGGKKVKQLVQMPFQFSLTKGE